MNDTCSLVSSGWALKGTPTVLAKLREPVLVTRSALHGRALRRRRRARMVTANQDFRSPDSLMLDASIHIS